MSELGHGVGRAPTGCLAALARTARVARVRAVLACWRRTRGAAAETLVVQFGTRCPCRSSPHLHPVHQPTDLPIHPLTHAHPLRWPLHAPLILLTAALAQFATDARRAAPECRVFGHVRFLIAGTVPNVSRDDMAERAPRYYPTTLTSCSCGALSHAHYTPRRHAQPCPAHRASPPRQSARSTRCSSPQPRAAKSTRRQALLRRPMRSCTLALEERGCLASLSSG